MMSFYLTIFVIMHHDHAAGKNSLLASVLVTASIAHYGNYFILDKKKRERERDRTFQSVLCHSCPWIKLE